MLFVNNRSNNAVNMLSTICDRVTGNTQRMDRYYIPKLSSTRTHSLTPMIIHSSTKITANFSKLVSPPSQ